MKLPDFIWHLETAIQSLQEQTKCDFYAKFLKKNGNLRSNFRLIGDLQILIFSATEGNFQDQAENIVAMLCTHLEHYLWSIKGYHIKEFQGRWRCASAPEVMFGKGMVLCTLINRGFSQNV